MPWTTTTTCEGSVAWLRFTGGAIPTATFADVEALQDRLATLPSDTRVVVLAGDDSGFVRHADLDDLIRLRQGEPATGDNRAWARVLRMIDDGPWVTIASITGDAWGGGCELALSCNLRWMADDATLGFPEVRLGIIPGVAGHRAARLLPEHLAFELLSGLAPISAPRAVAMNLVNGVLPADGLEPFVVETARRLADLSPRALNAARDVVIRSRDDDIRTQQRSQTIDFMNLLGEPEAAALLAAASARYRQGRVSADAVGFPTASSFKTPS